MHLQQFVGNNPTAFHDALGLTAQVTRLFAPYDKSAGNADGHALLELATDTMSCDKYEIWVDDKLVSVTSPVFGSVLPKRLYLPFDQNRIIDARPLGFGRGTVQVKGCCDPGVSLIDYTVDRRLSTPSPVVSGRVTGDDAGSPLVAFNTQFVVNWTEIEYSIPSDGATRLFRPAPAPNFVSIVALFENISVTYGDPVGGPVPTKALAGWTSVAPIHSILPRGARGWMFEPPRRQWFHHADLSVTWQLRFGNLALTGVLFGIAGAPTTTVRVP